MTLPKYSTDVHKAAKRDPNSWHLLSGSELLVGQISTLSGRIDSSSEEMQVLSR
jgi:hypothetical protein